MSALAPNLFFVFSIHLTASYYSFSESCTNQMSMTLKFSRQNEL